MARVDATGIEPTTLSGYVSRIGGVFTAALGNDLSLDTETPQGQLIDGLAILLAEIDESEVDLGNSFSIARSAGVAQDDNVSLLNVERRAASRSTVTATMGGSGGVVIPANYRVSTAAGDVFRTTAAATIGAGGTVDVDMESVETGPVPAAAAALTQIIDIIAGWESATNAAAAIPGRNAETAVQLRGRYSRHVGRNARGSIQALEAAILETAGVTDALVRENDTAASVTVQSQAIPARGTVSIVDGGTNAAVARTIADYKPGGGPTAGSIAETVAVLDADGMQVSTITINFARVVDVPITLTVPITVGVGFPADGLARISNGLVAYMEGQQISDPLDTTRLLVPILAVPGMQLGAVVAARRTGAGSVTDRTALNLFDRLTLESGDITINVS